VNLMAAAEGAPPTRLKAPSFPSLTQTGEGCAFTFFVCIFGGRAASQLDLTRAYRNIVRFSPSLIAPHIAASCFWGVGGAETKISATCCWTLPHSIFVTGATATRKSNRSRTVARFQSSLNQTPCLGGACALGMCALVEKNLKNIGCKYVFWEEDHYLLHCSVGEVTRLPP